MPSQPSSKTHEFGTDGRMPQPVGLLWQALRPLVPQNREVCLPQIKLQVIPHLNSAGGDKRNGRRRTESCVKPLHRLRAALASIEDGPQWPRQGPHTCSSSATHWAWPLAAAHNSGVPPFWFAWSTAAPACGTSRQPVGDGRRYWGGPGRLGLGFAGFARMPKIMSSRSLPCNPQN
jgi:hypothetical protein